MTFDIAPAHIRIRVDALQPLTLTHAHGTRLRAVAGTMWVTVDHDSRDWVLEPGDEMVVESTQRVLVTPLGRGETTIDVCTPTRGRRAGGFAVWAAMQARAIAGWFDARQPAAGPVLA